MSWKLGSVAPVHARYEHVIDGFVVTSVLSPEDMAGWSERRRLATLRRILRDTPNPRPAQEAS